MSAPLRPCVHCRVVLPGLQVSGEAFHAIVRALSNGSAALAAGELRHFANCKASEAQAWVDHLLVCSPAWPDFSDDQDREILRIIDQAFDGIPKPEHFTDHTHCAECAEHDATLRSRTRATLRREDLGQCGWDPVSFADGAGIAYYFPALARYALRPCLWRHFDWYGSQFLTHLARDGASNRLLLWCAPAQRDAVHALLEHMAATREADIEHCGEVDALLTALTAWQSPAAAPR